MKRLLGVTVLGLAGVFAGQAQAACSAADKAELEALDRAWSEAGRKGDKAAIAQFYSDDFHDLAPGAPQDKQAAIAAVSAGGNGEVTHDFYEIHCNGDSALVTHRNVGTWTDGDESGNWYSRSVHHLVREGGKWRVLANAGHPLDDAGVVAYLDLEWNLAELAGDKAWFERNLAEDFVGVNSRTGALEGKKATVDEIGTYRVTQAVSTELDVAVDGDTARASGIFHVKGTSPEGEAFERRVRYIDTFVRRDGRWQIWSSQGTPMPE